ncbi:hypothetical protein TanjilG_01762 [Lupinus angustifolius]|uniref:Probable purine permease n=1 Tax=Lupinus angustifolius TaxID=3871 RepID=A0A4P1RS99_LUPAN|nr:PREDICTED: purine permease 1-like [Lupinus angustifolius]XP_019427726.1 PREDICTED: purine permease 1-like [Lupinus angustifolius]XP_019427733.1 PREDICTED: purine permease 1-like [Lupinus angustifolius]OIW16897.1 hypothetical protein TanjilG_01762 [Lupinus angustifolius]
MVEGVEAQKERIMKRILLLVNCIIQVIGTCGGPLVIRLYYIHGGKRVWLSCFLQTCGFPILLVPLTISYIIRRRNRELVISNGTSKDKIFTMKLPLFLVFAVIGVLQGLDNILYSNGLAWLPVSTSVLIISTQLAFTAVFAFVLVRQKFTPYSVNAVIMLILGAVILALNGSGDRTAGETKKQYVKGFVMTLAAAVLYGFILPLVELVYKKAKQPITYSLVLEIQIVLSFFGTLFATVGMLINHDFKAIPIEAKHFKLGETIYYVVLVVTAILWQLSGLGAMGVIFCASSLMSGIMIAMSTPITEVLAVIFYKEKFQAVKGISLALSLWGFVSYFYGEFQETRKIKKDSIPETIQT